MASFSGSPLPFFETTSLSTADRWGNAVAFTQSLVSICGSGVIAGDTGIFLNNGHTFGFVLEEGHVNHLEGGQRAKGVMTPAAPTAATSSPSLITTHAATPFRRLSGR